MIKKLLSPLFICLILTAALGYALRLILLYSFFDSHTRSIVLVCLGLLFVAVWAAFWAEFRELTQRQKARVRAQAARLEQEQKLEQEALQQAAALLRDSPWENRGSEQGLPLENVSLGDRSVSKAPGKSTAGEDALASQAPMGSDSFALAADSQERPLCL